MGILADDNCILVPIGMINGYYNEVAVWRVII